jgi:hypothetical protein
MNKQDFEQAVVFAVNANSQNSHKWKPLERLFAIEKIRASGALINEDKQGGNRAQQLFDGTRKHAGFDSRGYNKHSIVVINEESAAQLNEDPSVLETKWIPEIKANRPDTLPPDQSADSVLLLRADQSENQTMLHPLVLMEWQESEVTARYRQWYPDMPVEPQQPNPQPAPHLAAAAHYPVTPTPVPGNDIERNVIFSGPPGVGKSHMVSEQTSGYEVFRTTFHPETTYGQFVGEYKVVVGHDPKLKIMGYDGEEIPRPISYFAFEPAVLTLALVEALLHPEKSVVLVIEEINRGDCAAIFGDFFQLLDRDATGMSEYPIKVAPSLATHLANAKALAAIDQNVAFPRNLFLFATMNTSDQSLYPMDAAFKRRWGWRTVNLMQGAEKLKDVFVEMPSSEVPLRWIDLVRVLNERIMAYASEDKRIGPWLLEAEGNVIPATAIREKLLHYLWHDVFRARREQLFDSSLRTFDAVQELFDSEGLTAVMPGIFEEPDDTGQMGLSSSDQPDSTSDQE